MESFGKWAFIIGAALAVIAGLLPTLGQQLWLPWALVVLGLVVGLLNVTAKETTEFLVAAIALMLTSPAAGTLGGVLSIILANIAVFVAPAALIVALKAVYDLAKN